MCKAKRKRHYVSRGDVSDKCTKPANLGQYRKTKKARNDETSKKDDIVENLAYTSSSPNFSIFKALFAEGSLEVELLRDQDVDANFISESML